MFQVFFFILIIFLFSAKSGRGDAKKWWGRGPTSLSPSAVPEEARILLVISDGTVREKRPKLTRYDGRRIQLNEMSATKMGVTNFQKIPVTSVTGVKIQSISLITNIEIQFMNSVKIIESNFVFHFIT